MKQLDPIFHEYWVQWQHVEVNTITQAACLLTMNNPAKYSTRHVLPSDAEAMTIAIEQAILLRRLQPFAVWAYDPECGELRAVAEDELSPYLNLSRDSTIRVEDLAAWCDLKGIEHYWPQQSSTDALGNPGMDTARYPIELRAAIDAFEAVSKNSAAIAGRSPRAALVQWLEANKPEIGANARERIATVANWQPAGGAPKTPGA